MTVPSSEINKPSGDIKEGSSPYAAFSTAKSNNTVPEVVYNPDLHSPSLVLVGDDDDDDFSDGEQPIKAARLGATRAWGVPATCSRPFARNTPGILTSKLPRHLMERWSAIDEDNVHLATLRIYHNTGRIVFILPPGSEDGDDGPERYEGTLSERDSVGRPHSGFVVAHQNKYVPASSVDLESESPDASSSDTMSSSPGSSYDRHPVPGKRFLRRRMALSGWRTHHCDSLRATGGDLERLGRHIKERYAVGNSLKRKAEKAELFTNDEPSRLGTKDEPTWTLPATRPKKKQKRDRMFRLPKDRVLDALFKLFERKEYWSMKEVRHETQQPEDYLKEILLEIATFHKSGEYRNTWALLPNFRHNRRSGDGSVPFLGHGPDVAGESRPSGEKEDATDESEDDDMEEVV